jgi:hypothetical protein
MNHGFVLATAMFLLSATAVAGDDYDKKHAGEKGYVTAYAADKTTLIDVDKCPLKGRSHDYAACGKPFRARIEAGLCSQKGKGKHDWYYRVGDSKSYLSNTAICK